MWKNIKDWAMHYGLWEEPKDDKQSDLEEAIKKVDREEKVNEFLENAISRYCKECDEFFKRAHSLNMHIRFKHKGGDING